MASETPLVGVERSDGIVVVGLPGVPPALVVSALGVEVPAVVVVGGVVVEGTSVTVMATEGCEDPGVVCPWLATTFVLSVTGIVRKMTTIWYSKL